MNKESVNKIEVIGKFNRLSDAIERKQMLSAFGIRAHIIIKGGFFIVEAEA